MGKNRQDTSWKASWRRRGAIEHSINGIVVGEEKALKKLNEKNVKTETKLRNYYINMCVCFHIMYIYINYRLH